MPRTGKKTEIAQDLVFQANSNTFIFRVFICVCASRQTRHGVLPEYPLSRSVCALLCVLFYSFVLQSVA